VTQSGPDKHPELKKLKPNDGRFWYASGLGILDYPSDAHESITNGTVAVVKADIKALDEGGKVRFADGSAIDVNAMVRSTGRNFAPVVNPCQKPLMQSPVSQAQSTRRHKQKFGTD
jgi:hypothetical protein